MLNRESSTSSGDGYRPASEWILDGVRQLILRGELKPGERIRQEALASEYGVSRIPVREALRQLENEGLVSLVPTAARGLPASTWRSASSSIGCVRR